MCPEDEAQREEGAFMIRLQYQLKIRNDQRKYLDVLFYCSKVKGQIYCWNQQIPFKF